MRLFCTPENDSYSLLTKHMTKHVETYFLEGCGRCALGGTPQCKVHRWHHELMALRRIILDCGLTEDCKWGVPCYTFNGKNIVSISALKENCVLSFFKGVLLQDEHGILTFPGDNSQIDKVIRFIRVEEIMKVEEWIKAYVFEAVEVEKAGVQVPKSNVLSIPEELQRKFEEVPAFRAAFEALTPSRQRGYLLYFSQPKQSQTRTSRIEKYLQKIFNGEGLQDKPK